MKEDISTKKDEEQPKSTPTDLHTFYFLKPKNET